MKAKIDRMNKLISDLGKNEAKLAETSVNLHNDLRNYFAETNTPPTLDQDVLRQLPARIRHKAELYSIFIEIHNKYQVIERSEMISTIIATQLEAYQSGEWTLNNHPCTNPTKVAEFRTLLEETLIPILAEIDENIEAIQADRTASEVVVDFLKSVLNAIIWLCTVSFVPSFFSTTTQPLNTLKHKLNSEKTFLPELIQIAGELLLSNQEENQEPQTALNL